MVSGAVATHGFSLLLLEHLDLFWLTIELVHKHLVFLRQINLRLLISCESERIARFIM